MENGRSPLDHPSFPPLGDEDRFDAIEQARKDGIITDEVAQEAISEVIAYDQPARGGLRLVASNRLHLLGGIAPGGAVYSRHSKRGKRE